MTNMLTSGVLIITSHTDCVLHEGSGLIKYLGNHHHCWHSSSMTEDITTMETYVLHKQWYTVLKTEIRTYTKATFYVDCISQKSACAFLISGVSKTFHFIRHPTGRNIPFSEIFCWWQHYCYTIYQLKHHKTTCHTIFIAQHNLFLNLHLFAAVVTVWRNYWWSSVSSHSLVVFWMNSACKPFA